MKQVSPDIRLPAFLLAAIAAAGLSAAAFYGWSAYGSSMLLTYSQMGLSGCL